MNIPEFAMNPLAHRIVRVFDRTFGHGSEVNFKDFVEVLAVFDPRATREDKLECILNIRKY